MTLRIALATLALTLGTFAAAAQDAATTTAAADPSGKLTMQLNKVVTDGANCLVTFVVRNDTAAAVERSAFELAIVDTDGAIAQLVKIGFPQLNPGRQKAQTFTFRDILCENISAISINEFTECVVAGAASPVCEASIVEESRAGVTIEFPWTL